MNVSSKFLRILLVPGEYYRTEGWVTETLLANVRFRGALWEPAAGDGAMVEILEAAGYRVIASDIEGAVRGCQGAETLDFLTAEAPCCTDRPVGVGSWAA